MNLTIALSKGRILEESAPLLARLGLAPKTGLDDRQLRLPSRVPGVQLLIVRPADVPTYVEYGAADLGIAGKDVLMEHGGDALYEPVDLGIARCRLVVAGRAKRVTSPARVQARIATKYPEITRRHFAARGEQVEIIQLYGSMELAPLVGLSDYIVDLVDTGRTLKANGLRELETIAEVSARLVVNKAAMKMKHERIREWLDRFRALAAAPAGRAPRAAARA
ncbi:MAG TPA: ATP phosphoribosyltransferase [Candidatus Binatia bacterium]|nr:ATP phosphoribosyltransferase [Candidatus Binatia bacterium]